MGLSCIFWGNFGAAHHQSILHRMVVICTPQPASDEAELGVQPLRGKVRCTDFQEAITRPIPKKLAQ